jgi:hypothetical protein
MPKGAKYTALCTFNHLRGGVSSTKSQKVCAFRQSWGCAGIPSDYCQLVRTFLEEAILCPKGNPKKNSLKDFLTLPYPNFVFSHSLVVP